MNFLLEHIAGCTPLNPCGNCQEAALLREKLSQAELAALSDLAMKLGVHLSSFGIDLEIAPLLQESIDVLNLEARPYNCLKSEKLYTIGDVVARRKDDLRCIPNLGSKSLSAIEEALLAKSPKLKLRK